MIIDVEDESHGAVDTALSPLPQACTEKGGQFTWQPVGGPAHLREGAVDGIDPKTDDLGFLGILNGASFTGMVAAQFEGKSIAAGGISVSSRVTTATGIAALTVPAQQPRRGGSPNVSALDKR